jgi:hypothetical protein
MGDRNQRTHPRHYRAWLLRSWAAQELGDSAAEDRRYSLEDPYTGARRGFATLAALVDYLRAEPGMDEAVSISAGE